MCDLSASSLRKFTLDENKIDYLEAFPERDIESKRVFKEVKMSVCILGATKRKVNSKKAKNEQLFLLFPLQIRRLFINLCVLVID